MRGAGDRPAPLSFCICSNYGVSKNNLDIRKATGGRYIGGVRDKSAPTGGRINVLNAIIGPYACPGYFIHLIYKEVKHE